MIWALLTRLLTGRKLLISIVLCAVAVACAPLLEVRIAPTVYLASAGASGVVATFLLVHSFFRVDTVRDYAQLPLGYGFAAALAVAQSVTVLVETIAPAAAFALARRELDAGQLVTLALVAVAACAAVLVATIVWTAPRRAPGVAALLLAAGAVVAAVTMAGSHLPAWAVAAVVAAAAFGVLATTRRVGALPPRGGGRDLRGVSGNYFWRVFLADRVILVNGLGVAAIAAVFVASSWSSGLHLPLAYALLAVNAPLSTLISAEPDLRRQLAMLGHPASIDRQYAATVAGLLGPVNALASVGYALLGATNVVALVALPLAVTAVEGVAIPLLERAFPLQVPGPREAWRHPRKYLLPVALVLVLGWVPLG